MNTFRTSIDSTKQVFDPSQGQARLTKQPPVAFQSPAATQHFQDVYRGQGQKAAVDLGRAATENQNNYYATAQKAQDQSVLAGLGLLGEQQANAYQRQSIADQMRYKYLEDIMSGPKGLLGGLL